MFLFSYYKPRQCNPYELFINILSQLDSRTKSEVDKFTMFYIECFIA